MQSITETAAWQNLQKHYQQMQNNSLQELFSAESERFKKYSLNAAGLFLDFSKNHVIQETLNLLLKLTEEVDLKAKINALFSGTPINFTEQRSVLHTALRSKSDAEVLQNEKNIIPIVQQQLTELRNFSEAVRLGEWRGYSGKRIDTIVNLGIGGSYLGPKMLAEALQPYANNFHIHFISNIDNDYLHLQLKKFNPETTLFIISSKSFTTTETLENAKFIQSWLLDHMQDSALLAKHVVAVTANEKAALQFGIAPTNIFKMWEWVGGRYSIWSAISLPIILAIGMDNFEDFLAGARAMDEHFQSVPFSENMPVILALLGIWYINFWGMPTHAVICYSELLKEFTNYLQQLDMESNGKVANQAGRFVDYLTGPILWGGQGTNGQHSFHQLLQQGTHLLPIDFIAILKTHYRTDNHILFANCLAQSQALLQGKTYQQAYNELLQAGHTPEQAEKLAIHKVMPGNRPSNTILLDKLTPYSLGALIALYEHKVFVQGILWQINSYDQWGVELGKQLANNLADKLSGNIDKNSIELDDSTRGLVEKFQSN